MEAPEHGDGVDVVVDASIAIGLAATVVDVDDEGDHGGDEPEVVIMEHLHVNYDDSSVDNDGSELLVLDSIDCTDDMLAGSMRLHDFDPVSNPPVIVTVEHLNRALKSWNFAGQAICFGRIITIGRKKGTGETNGILTSSTCKC